MTMIPMEDRTEEQHRHGIYVATDFYLVAKAEADRRRQERDRLILDAHAVGIPHEVIAEAAALPPDGGVWKVLSRYGLTKD